MKRLVWLAAALALAACESRPIAESEVEIRVTGAPAEVEIGRSFPLTVVRAWSRELEPDPWSDAALQPLVVRLSETSRREDAVFVEETRRFRAYAFEPGPATVQPVVFSAAPARGGPARTATADGFTIRVKGTLDPKTAGPPELPGLVAEPIRWWPWAAAVVVAAGAAILAASRRRKREAFASGTVPGPGDVAKERIELLRAQTPRSGAEIQAWHLEATDLLRDFLAETSTKRAREMTTEELIEASPAPERDHLAAALVACDLVKFGRGASSSGARERVLGAAERIVRPGPERSQQMPAKAGGPEAGGPASTRS